MFFPRWQRKFPCHTENQFRIAVFSRRDVLTSFILKPSRNNRFEENTCIELEGYLNNGCTCLIKHMRINSKSRSPCNCQSFRVGVEPPLGGSLPNPFKYKICGILDFCYTAVDFCRISWPLKMRPTSCPIKSATNYPFTLHTIAEEQKIRKDLVIADVVALWPRHWRKFESVWCPACWSLSGTRAEMCLSPSRLWLTIRINTIKLPEKS
jgi:hypothetical protein